MVDLILERIIIIIIIIIKFDVGYMVAVRNKINVLCDVFI
jgi:hypothetical protein